MGRNGNEVAIHECHVLRRIIDFGLLPFGRLWICRYCGEELNAAIDSRKLEHYSIQGNNNKKILLEDK